MPFRGLALSRWKSLDATSGTRSASFIARALMYGEPHSEAMAAAVPSGNQRRQAGARGAVLAWLDQPGRHDPAFIPAMREAMISAITTETASLPEPGRASAARALKANLPGQTSLSPAGQHLLSDWLDRLGREPGS